MAWRLSAYIHEFRGGENIYPREIEEYLYRHPKVQDVAICGVPDERLGEQVAACIKVRVGASTTRTRSARSAKSRSRITRCPPTFASSTNFP